METDRMKAEVFDVVVVGGGPAGATAADELGQLGHRVLLLERGTQIKSCSGAVPPRLIEDFDIPDELLHAKINEARILSPSQRAVSMPIEGGYVGMVDREVFDPWLRKRADRHPNVELRTGTFVQLRQNDALQQVSIEYRAGTDTLGVIHSVQAKMIIGADGCNSLVRNQGLYRDAPPSFMFDLSEFKRFLPGVSPMDYLSSYQEVVVAPEGYKTKSRCEIHYDSKISPDFYGWVFPHGDTISIGTSCKQRGFPLHKAVTELRERAGLSDATTIRESRAPLPLRPLKRWDNGRNVIVIGDAAGLVAPSSGEGIYYSMVSARAAAQAIHEALANARPSALASARKRFMKENARTFRMLGMMQRFWYANDKRRERFVSICGDKEVQEFSGTAYMRKRLVSVNPIKHARIVVKHIGRLTGLSAA